MGRFCRAGVGELHLCEGKVKKEQYLQIMQGPMLRSLRGLLGRRNAILQQDNAPVHTAALVQRWFTRQRLTVLDWPPQSPDMNPIEHCWDAIARRIADKVHGNKAELMASVTEAGEVFQRSTYRTWLTVCRGGSRPSSRQRVAPPPTDSYFAQ